MAVIVDLLNISKQYKNKPPLLNNLSLHVEEKDFQVVFGLPGSGKSVLMRLIMGLEKPDAGSIRLRGKDVEGANPGEHNIGYVPQSFALFPHQTVYQNIAYPLKVQGAGKAYVDEAVHSVSKMLSIEDLLEKKPNQTSGGQKQRIAIARGMIKHTDLYIFDDPFIGLDFKLREQLVYDLRELQEKLNTTFIYTTSDSSEALQLSKRVSVLHAGQIIETDAPIQLYGNPQHADSMRILGFPGSNMLEGEMKAGVLTMGEMVVEGIDKPDGKVIVGVRPEDFSIGLEGGDVFSFDAEVTLREDLGGEEILYFEALGQSLTMMLWHHTEIESLNLGRTIRVGVPKEKFCCFDASTKFRL